MLIRFLLDLLRNEGTYRKYVEIPLTCDFHIHLCLAYLCELEKAMEFVCNSPELTLEEKKRFFKGANTNLGSTALCLSGGATFGYCKFSTMRCQIELR